MARPGRPEPALVPIGLEVSEVDAARIDQVLARPEFAEWTRAEWCLEIIRTALRYYTGDGPAFVPGQAGAASAAESAAAASAVPSVPESAGRTECPHPADARDYETGTCAACGAILWD